MMAPSIYVFERCFERQAYFIADRHITAKKDEATTVQ